MKWTGLNEIRERYLSFFESKGHLRLPSFSLVPNNDKSLLLINSGMAPMKKYFTGELTPPKTRVTTCQKCIRTPDIERVGVTARHGTYFEMLGNFSFGDYFKMDATKWAWEFCVEVMDMPVDRLWVSIYENDDETFGIWTEHIGVSPDRIVRLGKEDNFWEHGTGPCGPCSEIYFDRGEAYGCGSADCAVGCDCDRYVEFWNLVFTQFDSDGHDNYTPLEHPNIDTGMGLERLACIMQGVDNLFLVDTVQNIMKHVSKVSGVVYGDSAKTDVSLRVVTDHIRSTVFMIGDGVMPSNEGRGYVLRRLLRRAARHGRLLGIKETFLVDICDTVIKENAAAYPELLEKQDFIKKLISVEEDSFARTIDQGFALLTQILDKADETVLSGDIAFKLNDTFGFPIDLTKEILMERGKTVDEEGFMALMKEQKTRARAARKNAGADAWTGENNALEDTPATEFVGYENDSVQAEILAIVKNGELSLTAAAGDEVIVALDRTPFYAESGGQVGDKGTLSAGVAVGKVLDTLKNPTGTYLHKVVVEQGELKVGDVLTAMVDADTRSATKRNHTAAHLLQAALRTVLGSHVQQAGQMVDDKEMRFDFTHFSAMTPEEILKVETLVNAEILKGAAVNVSEMPIEEARKLGAMALFGEKYADVVRVVKAGDFSVELCGGTHIDNTAKLGLFKIVSESSVAAGVRRLSGVTGMAVLENLRDNVAVIHQAAVALKLSSVADLVRRCGQIVLESKEKDREIEALRSKLAASQVDELVDQAVDMGGVKLITGKIEGANADALRGMGDKIRDLSPANVAVLCGVADGKLVFASVVGKEAQSKGAHAGNIVREIAKIAGGNGGGRPDSAMAGAKDVAKADEALAAVESVVWEMIS